MSFYDRLKAAAEGDKIRLHTPGHKGRLCGLDLTELTDDSFPSAGVAEAERHAAEIYGAKHARFLCGGSSQGVKAAVLYADAPFIADVNSHRSVFDGAILGGVRCQTAGERGSIYPLTVKQICDALDDRIVPEPKAVLVTTPTYYGYCADTDGIADLCKKRGLLFIADSAHGAHFGFSKHLPNSVVPRCDICNVSAHKTLSALTQTALIFDNLNDDGSSALSCAVDRMGTTSPSYLLYASLDYAVTEVARAETAQKYALLYDAVSDLKAEFPFLKNDDFTRLVLDCASLRLSPTKLNGALARRGVYSELVSDKYIVFIITAEDAPSDVEEFKRILADGIREIQ